MIECLFVGFAVGSAVGSARLPGFNFEVLWIAQRSYEICDDGLLL